MINKYKGHLLAMLTVTIWSSTFIVSKILLNQLTPLQILIFRFVIAVSFLSIIYPKFKRPSNIKEELLFFVTGGCLALYFFFENSALIHTYSSNVSLIVSTIPLITGVLSAIFYKTSFFTKKSIFGFVIAYLGVFLIILNGNKLAGIEPIGDLFALIAAVMFALYTLVMQKIEKTYHLIEMTRKVMLYGLVLLGVIVVVSKQSLYIEKIDVRFAMSMLFLGIVASSLAFLMWNKAIQMIGSIKTNQYIYLVPVITTVFSAIVLREAITIITILGAGLIIFGLYLSENEKETKTEIEAENETETKIKSENEVINKATNEETTEITTHTTETVMDIEIGLKMEPDEI
ncbi:MAG: EamA family transporter [Firmicutes bacterium HGW-Firmicutes-7]|nr:MAG: EamA family transporter [Firmicutes bacterium HGW-Firmicutes-7]